MTDDTPVTPGVDNAVARRIAGEAKLASGAATRTSHLDLAPLIRSLDAALERGLADAKAGRVKPANEIFDRLEAKYKTMK